MPVGGGLAIEVVFPPAPARGGDQVEDQAGAEEQAAALA